MELIDAGRCALVLVDYQSRLLPAIHRGAEVIAEAARLADVARELGISVIGTEQNPAGLGPNDPAIRQRCDQVLTKMHFDACEDGLVGLLRDRDGEPLPEVVVAGCETHVCLLQTALGLLRARMRVWVVAQACGTRSPEDHELALQRLRQAGAVIVSAEMVIFEWLRTCEHAAFRRVLPLVKSPPQVIPRPQVNSLLGKGQ